MGCPSAISVRKNIITMILPNCLFRAHLSQYGVSVHIIEPGNFQTGLLTKETVRKGVQKAWDRAPRYIREEYGKTYFENCMLQI